MATDFQEVKKIAWKVVEELFGIVPISAAATGTPSATTALMGNFSWASVQPLDTQLTDIAALTYSGNALKVIRVNAGATAFELAANGVAWTTIAVSGSLAKTTGYVFTANNIAAALPSSPSDGDNVFGRSATSALTGCSVTRAGNKIMGLAEDMTLDDSQDFFWGLVYTASTTDWRLI